MDDMERKRRKIEEKRQAQNLREYLSRQHRLKLLAKTQQIQKDLEEDKRLLDEVTAFTTVRDAHAIEERNEKNQRLTWLRDVIDRYSKRKFNKIKCMLVVSILCSRNSKFLVEFSGNKG